MDTRAAKAGDEARSTMRRIAAAVGVGAGAGLLSGLFGVGGGTLIVPGLVIALGFAQRIAHGTSLVAVVPISAAAVARFAVDGSVDWGAVLPLASGAMMGAVLGTAILQRAPERALRLGFAALLVATAVRMFFPLPEAEGRVVLDALGIVGLVATGWVAGTAGSLLGVGGGIVLVPALAIAFGFEQVVAKGTSLAVIVPMAVVATIRNAAKRNVDLRTGITLGLAGAVTAPLGAQLALGMDPEVSAGLFAALLVAIVARLLVSRRRAPLVVEEDPGASAGPVA